MRVLQVLTSKNSIALLSLFASSSAFATGATVRIGGSATSVPSLSGSMLIVLSLLLFVVAFRIAKQKGNEAGKFFITLIGVSAFLAAGNGIKLISDTNAGLTFPNTYVPLSAGILEYQAQENGRTNMENTSGQPLTIISITPDLTSSCSFVGVVAPCTNTTLIPLIAPLELPAGYVCFLDCFANP